MDDTQIPAPVVAAVEAASSGPVLDGLPTAVVWKFPHPDGHVTQATVWALRTAGQFWLAAVEGDDVFLSATGDAGAVSVHRGWARDQLRFPGRALALARRGADRAEALVSAFRLDAGGPTYPPPARPVVTSPRAEGASTVPDWWVDVVAGDPGDRWLHAYTTGSEWTFNLDAGVRTAPLVVGIRGRAVAVAAHLSGETHAEVVEGPATSVTGLGWTRIELGAYRLNAGRRDGARVEALVQMINGDEGRRWALAGAMALDEGRADDAEKLWRGALERKHRSSAQRELALLALAVDRPARAVTLLKALDDDVDAEGIARVSAWRRTAAKAQAALQRLIDEHVDEAKPPTPGWPWPPRGPTEALLAAGSSAVSADELTPEPRRRQVQAALAERRDPPAVAAAAFRAAARAWAAAGDEAQAYRTLQSALRLDSDSLDHFQAAIWAGAAGRADQVEVHLDAGLRLAPSAEPLIALAPPAAVLTAAASVAEAQGHRRTAADLSVRAFEMGGGDRDQTLALARRLAGPLKAPAEAAALVATVAETADAESEDGTDALWLEVAEFRRQAGLVGPTLDALRRAVQAGFLRPEVYRRAASFRPMVEPALADWWAHIAFVLSATPPEGRPRPPAAGLTRARLDELHPGGAGWLADVKQWLDEPAPPGRDHLVRGLERIESAGFAGAFGVINDVSRRLEIVPPAAYVYRGDDAFGLSAWPVQPPVLLVGHQHLVEGPRRMSEAALTFAVGVELAHLACGHPVLSFDGSLVGTSKSAYQAFGRFAGRYETFVDLITMVPGIDQLAKLQRLIRISRRVITGWKTVNKASTFASPLLKRFGSGDGGDPAGVGRQRLEGAALQFRIQADRAALLLGGSVAAAAEAVLKTSARGVVKLDALEREGLVSLLQSGSDALAADELIRLSALLAWSAGLETGNGVDQSGPAV